MAVNDTADPEIDIILARIREYGRCYDFGAEPLTRERVKHLYKQDEDFTAYDVAPPAGGYLGWNAYAKGWDHLTHKFSRFHFELGDDIRAFRRGDVAWASMSCASSGASADGTPFRKELRTSLVMVKEHGEWLVTQEHVSAPRLFELPGGTKV